MLGFVLEHDRRWKIKTPECEGEIAEYNFELTGFDVCFAGLSAEFKYGGNAYYIINTLAVQRGWIVTEIPREG